jgi:hypothetical protein
VKKTISSYKYLYWKPLWKLDLPRGNSKFGIVAILKLIFNKYDLDFINYYQQMHYIEIKITQITVFYMTIFAATCFDPLGSSSGSSEGPY